MNSLDQLDMRRDKIVCWMEAQIKIKNQKRFNRYTKEFNAIQLSKLFNHMNTWLWFYEDFGTLPSDEEFRGKTEICDNLEKLIKHFTKYVGWDVEDGLKMTFNPPVPDGFRKIVRSW